MFKNKAPEIHSLGFNSTAPFILGGGSGAVLNALFKRATLKLNPAALI
jgi:hypothetical protein